VAPLGTSTRTLTEPTASPAGTVSVSASGPSTRIPVAWLAPKKTFAPSAKPCPATVTVSPPASAPSAGNTSVTRTSPSLR